MLEIERKFLVKKLPYSLEDFPERKIKQGYLMDEEGKRIRIRQKWDTYYKTYKIGQWLVREEIEKEIEKSEFDKKWKSVGKNYLRKVRYEIPHERYKIELDIFQGKLKWLMCAEIEFPSEEEAKVFVIPKWFDVELTDVKEAGNSYLAKHGISDEIKALMK